ncbi:unnamed protein product [Arabis nemorensis]|uniref:Guanylate kinase/L-type calcium channel beta subunit domain-containing protein n=1 Tax=Arabis nemorensis TaxID=586526 RepID=A0A565BRY4_9BRAS|nr:unnamed protein product [Arabis nemorensis]
MFASVESPFVREQRKLLLGVKESGSKTPKNFVAMKCLERGSKVHFSDKTAMEKEIKDGRFLDFASVHGNRYGTSIQSVEVVTDIACC